MAEWKISPELKAELEGLTMAGVVERIRIMVEIEPLISTLEAAAETLAVQYGAEVVYKSAVINYASILVDSDKVYAIAAEPWVKRIWHVPTVELVERGEFVEGIELPMLELTPEELAVAATVSLMETAEYLGVKRAKEKGYSGSGVVVAIVDSGIESTHPMLQGLIVAEKNFTTGPDPGDRFGHGTWCASAAVGKYWDSPVGPLQGMAPEAKLINAKIFETGSTSNDVAMAGLEWACAQGAHILSNSWGGGFYQPLRDLIIALKEMYGAIFVCAAGNDGPLAGTISYPGGLPEAVCVGSVAVINPSPDSVTTFSSRGPNWQGDIRPDIAAPGGNRDPDECIYGAFIGGTVKCWRGTSMATPHIAGALALILESGMDVGELYNVARDIDVLGKDNKSGYGIPRVDESVGLLPLTSTVLGVTVEPPSYTHSDVPFGFAGTLKEKTGVPLGGETVWLILNTEQVLSTTTDAEGRWAFDIGLPKGTHELYSLSLRTETHSGSRTVLYIVAVDTTGITVTVAPSAKVDIGEPFNFAGVLADALGNLLPDRAINLMQVGIANPLSSMMTDSEGRWSFTHLFGEKGRYMVYVRFEGNEFAGSQSEDYSISVGLSEAFFVIESIEIPESLAPGEEIFITVWTHNIGEDTGTMRQGLFRHWDQSTRIFSRTFTLEPCKRMMITYGLEWMPNVDATYTIWTQHLDLLTGEWIDDDAKIVTVKVISPQPEFTLTIISTTGGTTDPPPGSYNHPEGSTVRATAYPESGYRFDHWDLDGVVRMENPIDLLMDAGHILQAIFVEEPVPTHTLTIETIGQGTTEPAPGAWEYPEGAEVTVTAIPAEGWLFDRWEGDISSTDNPVSLTITRDIAITAVFVQITHILTIETVGQGTTNPAPGAWEYEDGAPVSVTAIPDAGWAFDHWEGNISGSENPVQFTITANMRIVAVFNELPPPQYTVDISVVGQGTTDPAPGTYTVDEGTILTVTAIPAQGYLFDHWEGDVSGTNPVLEVQVLSDLSIVAVFVEQPVPTYTLTIETLGQGTTNPAPGAWEYEDGALVSVSAIPVAGWLFERWEGDITSTENPVEFIITSDMRIVAVFSEVEVPPEQCAVSISVVGQGTTDPAPGTYTVDKGAILTITAYSAEGWLFDHWEGDISGTANPIDVEVLTDISVVAVFVEAPAPPPKPRWVWPVVGVTAIIAVGVVIAQGERKK